MTAERACARCLRRTWLLGELAGAIEIARRARTPLPDLLSLSDRALARALLGADGDLIVDRVARVTGDEMRSSYAVAGLRAVCRHDEAYPAALLDDRAPPAVLGVHGDLSLAATTAIAVVGTRRCSTDGAEVARGLARGLAAAGVTVVSGMALGIDSAAHEGALDVGGPTVAVLAGGTDVPYPASKRGLYARIARDGLILAELPPGTRPWRWCFPARNRIIATLTRATIVVEAAARSGSLITAELAADAGRDIGAVPGPVLSWRSAGANALLRDGAAVVRDPADAIELALGPEAGAAAAAAATVDPAPGLPADLRRLLARLTGAGTPVDELAASPAQLDRVLTGLATLELRGLARRGADGRWQPVAR